ncbi:MAG: peptidoglycan-binding protein, partial [Phenylobacterium sp.]|nr:peptidoglycan-binding protein [Phenylobacterium sp.]
SQYNLGRLYEEGFGVSQNAAEAYKWFMIAGGAGDKDAAASAERIKDALTPAAQAVAERAASAFRPTEPAPPTAVAAAAAPGVSPEALQTAQRALSRLGYYQGPTDGAASPALRLAVAAYQRDQGLAATGALDQTTVSKLSVFTR